MTKQSGNMLFILLVCIALLGGLAALMTRSSGSSDDTGVSEQASIQASDILKYAAGIETAVQTLIARGCSENQISFDADPANASDYDNPNSPTDLSCHVFMPQGGGIQYKASFPNLGGELIIVQSRVNSFDSSENLGTSKPELVLLYKFESKNELCKSINSRLGSAHTIWESGGAHNETKFTGAYTGSPNGINMNSIGGNLVPPASGCFCDGGDPSCATATDYWFYHTLIKR